MRAIVCIIFGLLSYVNLTHSVEKEQLAPFSDFIDHQNFDHSADQTGKIYINPEKIYPTKNGLFFAISDELDFATF